MSCEDSLSQSMLANEVVKDRPLFSNVDVSARLDEIEALQKGLEADVSKKASSPFTTSLLKPTLDKIKTSLTKVNQELTKEKKSLSDLKISFSQSLSQLDTGSSQNELKIRAAKLVSQQKRLLGAFKVQKTLMAKIKERNDDNFSDTNESFIVTESRTMAQQPNAPVTVPGKEGQKDSIAQAKLFSSTFAKFKESEGAPIAIQAIESQTKSLVPAKAVQYTAPRNAKSTRQFSQILENLSKAIVKNNPQQVQKAIASVQTVKGSKVENFSAGNNVTKTTYVVPSSVATSVPLLIAKHGVQDLGNPASTIKIIGLQQNMMPKIADVPQRIEIAPKLPVVPQSSTTNKVTLPGSDQSFEGNVKQETQKMKPTGRKKQPRKEKAAPAKKAAIGQKSVARNNKQHTKQGITSLIHAMKMVGKEDHNTTDALPLLRPPSAKRDSKVVDVSLLKFVVTMKDEEFLQSSSFLPEDFWKKNFEEITVDKKFLNNISFDEW